MFPIHSSAATLLTLLSLFPQQVDTLKTVAEQSSYRATARHGDVVALCKELAKRYPDAAQYSELGLSAEGRPLPLLILADPPRTVPARCTGQHRGIAWPTPCIE